MSVRSSLRQIRSETTTSSSVYQNPRRSQVPVLSSRAGSKPKAWASPPGTQEPSDGRIADEEVGSAIGSKIGSPATSMGGGSSSPSVGVPYSVSCEKPGSVRGGGGSSNWAAQAVGATPEYAAMARTRNIIRCFTALASLPKFFSISVGRNYCQNISQWIHRLLRPAYKVITVKFAEIAISQLTGSVAVKSLILRSFAEPPVSLDETPLIKFPSGCLVEFRMLKPMSAQAVFANMLGKEV